MIKVTIETTERGTKKLIFETSRPDDEQELDELDSILEALASQRPKRGGFPSSHICVIEVKNEF